MATQPYDPMVAIEAELQEERAYALGLAGKKVEAAMADLERAPDDEDLLDDAGTAVWHYLIVRESVHLFDHAEALAIYGIPGRVLARVGVIRRTPRP